MTSKRRLVCGVLIDVLKSYNPLHRDKTWVSKRCIVSGATQRHPPKSGGLHLHAPRKRSSRTRILPRRARHGASLLLVRLEGVASANEPHGGWPTSARASSVEPVYRPQSFIHSKSDLGIAFQLARYDFASECMHHRPLATAHAASTLTPRKLNLWKILRLIVTKPPAIPSSVASPRVRPRPTEPYIHRP
jgi:hypothetical protein